MIINSARFKFIGKNGLLALKFIDSKLDAIFFLGWGVLFFVFRRKAF